MKKKLRHLLEDPRLSENTEWSSIQKEHQKAHKKWEKAKSDKEKAKSAYKAAEAAGNKKDPDDLARLHTRYHQAKAMLQYHKLGFKLAEYQQKRWLESYTADHPAMLMMDPDKLGDKAAKAPGRKKQIKPSPKSPSGTES